MRARGQTEFRAARLAGATPLVVSYQVPYELPA